MKNRIKSLGRRNILLALVALVLVTVMTVGVSYSWIDDLADVKIDINDNSTDGKPLEVGHRISSDFVLTKNENETSEINIGPTFANSNASTKTAEVSDGGYFYESGDIHLSPCYGDGNSFYVPKKNGKFRKLNNDDYNVSVISATIDIQSPDYKSEFWFKEIPTFNLKKADSSVVANVDEIIHVAITVDGKTEVYGISDEYTSCDGNNTSTDTGRLFSKYTYDNVANTSDARGKNGNTLFSIAKGETKTVNFKIWADADGFKPNSQIALSDLDFKLVSSYSKSRNITIVNRTTGINSGTWMFNDTAKIYVAIPEARVKDNNGNLAWDLGVSYWDITEKLKTGFATIPIPDAFNNDEMFIFRCNSGGWNTSTTDTIPLSRYGINGYNFWATLLPDSFDDEVYTMYGSSYDDSIAYVYNNSWTFFNERNKGYGTWGDVVRIRVNAKKSTYNGNGCYAYYMHNSNGTADGRHNLFVEDFSDFEKNGYAYYYTMYPEFYDGNDTIWVGYVPQYSTKIGLHYFYESAAVADDRDRYWGVLTQTSETVTGSRPNPPTVSEIKKGYSRGTYTEFVPKNKTQGKWQSSSDSVVPVEKYLTENQAKESTGAGKKYFLYGNFKGTNGVDENRFVEFTRSDSDATEYKLYIDLKESNDGTDANARNLTNVYFAEINNGNVSYYSCNTINQTYTITGANNIQFSTDGARGQATIKLPDSKVYYFKLKIDDSNSADNRKLSWNYS